MTTFISAQLRGPLLAFLDEKGLRASACRRRLALWNPESQVALIDALMCLDLIDREYRNPALAFEIAEYVNLNHLGALGHLCLLCDNLGEVIARASHFYRVVWKGMQLELPVSDDEITVSWRAVDQVPQELSRAMQSLYVIGMAGHIRLVRLLVGEEFILRRVILPQPEPIDRASWEIYFRCPVEFKNAMASLTIAISNMMLPIRHDSDSLRKSVERQMEKEFTPLVCNDEFLQTVQQIIMRGLHNGTPTIEYVAAALSISRTTLHRRIIARGVSFRQLLDDIRFTLAQVYLRDASLPLSHITALLGFSEQSAFTRSFRRRTGVSPGHFRSGL